MSCSIPFWISQAAFVGGVATITGSICFQNKNEAEIDGNSSINVLNLSLLGGLLLGGAGLIGTLSSLNSKKCSVGNNENKPYGIIVSKASSSEKSKQHNFRPLREVFVEKFQPLIVDKCVDMMKNRYGMPDAAIDHMIRMLNYNVPGGKLNRGLTVVEACRSITKANGASDLYLNEAAFDKAIVAGWGIELLQASFLVADDIMDSSITRRGNPCWYKQPDIDMAAVNDAVILLSLVDVMIMEYFSDDPELLTRIRQVFTETQFQTELGQLLDLTTQPIVGEMDLKKYTMERYKKIVEYKTAYYTCYAPVALGMLLAGDRSPSSFEFAKKVCGKVGEYFQIQDDYLDCYGKPEVIGKIGTDIQDKKCSWLVVQALKLADAKQRQLLEDNYGKDDEKAIQVVKKVYEELQLEKLYQTYEEQAYQEITSLLKSSSNTGLVEVIGSLLAKIYKRSK